MTQVNEGAIVLLRTHGISRFWKYVVLEHQRTTFRICHRRVVESWFPTGSTKDWSMPFCSPRSQGYATFFKGTLYAYYYLEGELYFRVGERSYLVDDSLTVRLDRVWTSPLLERWRFRATQGTETICDVKFFIYPRLLIFREDDWPVDESDIFFFFGVVEYIGTDADRQTRKESSKRYLRYFDPAEEIVRAQQNVQRLQLMLDAMHRNSATKRE